MVYEGDVGIRADPGNFDSRTGEVLTSGRVFQVSEEKIIDGTLGVSFHAGRYAR